MISDHGIQYKYLRIQGRELAENTLFPKGLFSMCEKLAESGGMEQEDKDLLLEIDKWIATVLPFPKQCQNGEKVVCYFKTENSEEMLNLVKPMLWMLDKYKQPYYLVYTNYPGEIIYEDKYQIVVKVYDMVIEKIEKKVTGK